MSSVPFHFTSQETQNHGFRFCAHYSISPFSQQQNPSNQNKHGFTLSKMEMSRYFSTFIRERTQIPDVKNKEMTSTKPLSSSIYTHITNQKPRYLSSSSDPEKSQNDPSKLPSFKHQETEKPDESSEAFARWVMKKIFLPTKIVSYGTTSHWA
ncbi:hypothetical protein MANES_04G153900v8 [Manihot esculenta]|uniref:Uncharacterized protein n=1 Tax=Manihot esculenta TaxID=3983 RepID=A0A251L4L5_MANES|nr:hypothetical protein MANES_04G153900v8 [Manihot esculenta]